MPVEDSNWRLSLGNFTGPEKGGSVTMTTGCFVRDAGKGVMFTMTRGVIRSRGSRKGRFARDDRRGFVRDGTTVQLFVAV